MRTYQAIGMACLGLLVSSCSAPPKPMSAPPPPWRICAEGEDPVLTGCRKNSPTSSITVRGHHENIEPEN